MNCPTCGFELSEGLPFCVNCGAAVPQTETTSASAAAQTADSTRQAQTAAQQAQTTPLPPQVYPSPPPYSSSPPPARKSGRAWLFVVGLISLIVIAAVVVLMFMGGMGKRNQQRANVNVPNNRNANIAHTQSSAANSQSGANANVAPQAEGLKQTLAGQTKEITAVAYLPDKKTLASASLDGSVKLWDAQTGTLKQTVDEQGGGVVSLAFSADGTTAAVAVVNNGGVGVVFLSDMQAGQIGAARQKIERNNIQSVAFAPDGKTLAVGNTSGSLTLWDTTTGTLKQTLEGQDIQTRSVTFAPDGKWIAAGGYGNTVKLWD